MKAHTEIQLEIDARVAHVEFSGKGGIQILSSVTRARLHDVLDELGGCVGLQAVVFRARGRTFIAGADINELAACTPETAYEMARSGQVLMQRIEDLPVPTVAAIHAACAGGGTELALACDLRIAAGTARIGLPETSIGILPGWGGTVRATRLLGDHSARHIILAGELFEAERAREIGLVHEVAPDAEFPELVNAWCARLLRRGPTALRASKRLIRSISSGSHHEFLTEAELFAGCYREGQAQEGLNAFLEKRMPNWWDVVSP